MEGAALAGKGRGRKEEEERGGRAWPAMARAQGSCGCAWECGGGGAAAPGAEAAAMEGAALGSDYHVRPPPLATLTLKPRC